MARKEETAHELIVNLPHWEPIPGVFYKHDYRILATKYGSEPISEQLGLIRYWILNDLFFTLYFGMQWSDGPEKVNRKFIVDRCNEVQDGPQSETLDLWSREHFKSSIRSARLIQRILKYPERSALIASKTKGLAVAHANTVKSTFEKSDLLKACFPDVLYQDPKSESPKWTEIDGFTVKRKTTRKEQTVETCGILEGMPTGKHYNYIDVDDLEDRETVENPEQTTKVNDKFDDLYPLRSGADAELTVWGTPWSHVGTYIPYLEDKTWPEDSEKAGQSVFHVRKYSVTDDGTDTGKLRLLSDDEWLKIRATVNDYTRNCQYHINPTPIGKRRLNPRGLQEVEPQFVPQGTLKLLVVDPAGDLLPGKKKGNAWAIIRVGVQMESDNMGLSRCYIEDAAVKAMSNTEATETAVRMYLEGGFVSKVGIEKAGMTTFHQHLTEALMQRGRFISTDNGTLVLLSHGRVNPEQRVVDALELPFNNGKWFISKSVPQEYRTRIFAEIDKFPHFHPDALVAMAYVYELIKDFHFAGAQKPKVLTRPQHAYGVR